MANKNPTARHTGILLAAPSTIYMLIFFALPLLLVAGMSVLTRGSIPSDAELPFTVSNYEAVFREPTFSILVRSIRIALLSTLICFILGYPFAFFIGTRKKNWVRQVSLFLVILPFWTNFLIRTYAWQIILGRRGILNEVLMNKLGWRDDPVELLGTEKAVILGLVYGYLPFMVLPIYAVVERFRFNLVEAGHDLGANDWSVFWEIVFPLTLPGVIVGWILVFIPCIGAFITPNLLGGTKGYMIGNFIQSQFYEAGGSWSGGAASSIVLIGLVSLALLGYVRYGDRASHEKPPGVIGRLFSRIISILVFPIQWITEKLVEVSASAHPSPKVRRATLLRDRSIRLIGRALLWLSSLWCYIFLWLPIILLVLYSFNASRRAGGNWDGFTTEWYSGVFHGISGRGSDFSTDRLVSALQTSLKISLSATLIAIILGTMVALALVRGRFRGKQMLSGLLVLPVTIPNVTMGVALLIFFKILFNTLESIFGGDISTNIVAVILAHVAFSISYVAIVVRARLTDMNPSYEEASSDLGMNAWETFWSITYPLILPGIIAGGLLAFTLSLDDFVITFFVGGGTITTLPVYVWSLISRGVTPQINVVSTLMILASALLIALSLIFQGRNTAPRS